MNRFDLIVVGGGHAGVEAAAAAARIGARVALMTHNRSQIGAMSCNPAFGGLGKGHLIREIDALDGVMGRAADSAAIQFRMLNRSKGPAVQGPRVQADRELYKQAVAEQLASIENFIVLEDQCDRLRIENGRIAGVEATSGVWYSCGAVVLATGTFLNGIMHIGGQKTSGGRVGERAVTKLADQFKELGFQVGRLKTGTPPRLCGASIRYAALEPQWGDERPRYLSFLSDKPACNQIPCYITRTNDVTHGIIQSNLDKTAVYSGAISGLGPRYCPSIEDKVVRFASRASHQIFLEPEGLEMNTIYPNGLSTSLPAHLQEAFVRSIEGLENARIVQFGYAIEYDYVNPTQLHSTLMTNRIKGLFLCGQINGTTGYEEAGAQGLVAGINAARYVASGAEQIFDRADSYIGVMVDDLVTRGVAEPYRMFTSRAEYRLRLRADNADERLTPLGINLGVVRNRRARAYQASASKIAGAMGTLCSNSASAKDLCAAGVAVLDNSGAKRSAFEWASRPEVKLADLDRIWPEIAAIDESVIERLEADAKYAVYLARQEADFKRHRMDESLRIPQDLDFRSIEGLSNELKSKFDRQRPNSIGQAGRIEGVTPSALMLLAVHARRMAS